MDSIFIFGVIALILFIIIFIIRIPIIVAKKRGLKENDVHVIALLSWVSLFIGITWIVALIMSLVYQPPKPDVNRQSNRNELDELSKLFEMKENGILTQEQFEKAKENLLRR